MYGKTKWIITVVQAIFFLLFFPGAGGVLFTNIVCCMIIGVIIYMQYIGVILSYLSVPTLPTLPRTRQWHSRTGPASWYLPSP